MESALLPSDAILAADAAELIGASKSTIHRWVEAGVIPGWRRGVRGRKPRLVVSRADVLAQVEVVPAKTGAVRPVGKTELAERRRRTESILKRVGLAR